MKKVQQRAAATPSGSASDTVCKHVVEGLYASRFVPGQRLLEQDIALGCGVSRSSVREAFSRLAAEGVVVVIPYRGAEIRRLSRVEVADILEVIELLVGLAGRRAALNIDKDDNREAFDEAFKELISLEGYSEPLKLILARNRFYRKLNQVGGNGELARLLPITQVHLVRVQFRPFNMDAEKERFLDYRQMAEAIFAGDARRAEFAGQEHIRRLVASIEALPDEAFRADNLRARPRGEDGHRPQHGIA